MREWKSVGAAAAGEEEEEGVGYWLLAGAVAVQ